MNNFKRSKFPFWYIWILGWISIFDGIVMIITLGFYTSQFTLPYVMNFHKRTIKSKNP